MVVVPVVAVIVASFVHTTHPLATGLVHGKFELTGGAGVTTRPTPLGGLVTLAPASPSLSPITVVVDSSGTFVVTLAPGVWSVSGQSPQYVTSTGPVTCRSSSPVTVRSHLVVTLTLTCHAKLMTKGIGQAS